MLASGCRELRNGNIWKAMIMQQQLDAPIGQTVMKLP